MSRVCVIVPAYNAAQTLARAVDSVLAQTAPTTPIVVDDGSTDETERVAKSYGRDVTYVRIPNSGGPARPRNVGLDVARRTGYDFASFLDADDELAPLKVELQANLIGRFSEIGWVYCDVLIRDAARGSAQKASEKYGYASRPALSGDLSDQLERGNFIPVHAPLFRLRVVEGLTFPEGAACEDWDFWLNLSRRAPALYLDEVLATYHKGRTGRHVGARRAPVAVAPTDGDVVPPLRLNLGCGTPGARSWHPLPGMVNLDKSLGWTHESGLGQFADRSVWGITISHSLMYVPQSLWPYVFSEYHRVLVNRHDHDLAGGVLRVTEDDCFHPQSSRRGGWRGSESAVTLTSARLVLEAMRRAGFKAYQEVGPGETSFHDGSLCQRYHGDPPHVFHVEGIKV